jgi:Zn-dependent alcohol dehydrogenase
MPYCSFPSVFGHEGAGIVRELGSGLSESTVKVGDRVILSYCSCLDCDACKAGSKGACEVIAATNFIGTRGDSDSAIRTTDGRQVRGTFFGQSSFSKMAVVDYRAVVKYDGPKDQFAALAPLACGYTAGAGTVLNVFKLKPGSTIAIFGLGAVGLAALMAAKYAQAKEIVAVDLLDSRLQTAKELGATHIINSSKLESIGKAVRERLPQGVKYIVDTTGSTAVINDGMREVLGHGGCLAIVGTPKPQQSLNIEAFDMLTQCKTIIGVAGGFCDPQKVRRAT